VPQQEPPGIFTQVAAGTGVDDDPTVWHMAAILAGGSLNR
jgi:hypothetical protein